MDVASSSVQVHVHRFKPRHTSRACLLGMALDLAGWRRRWRARGVGLDRTLPVCFGPAVPPVASLASRVPRMVVVPDAGKVKLDDADVSAVVESADFMMAFIAEFLPVQIVANDAKPLLPGAASTLAVKTVSGEGEGTYLGSFDLVARIFATRAGPWLAHSREEMVIDCKMTGASCCLGVNGPTMRTYIAHAQMVMKEARKAGGRVAECSVVAFLLHRPRGLTRDGRPHGGSYGFVAFKVDTLLAWDARKSVRAPSFIHMCGKLLEAGVGREPGSLPQPPPAARPPPRDRWADLEAIAVAPGRVLLLDFCGVFRIGVGNVKQAAQRVSKRLRDEGVVLGSHNDGGAGRPPKTARLSDLRRKYRQLV